MTIRLVLGDDHRVVLHGLEALLSLEPDLAVCALCTDGMEVTEAVIEHRPDVLVIDASMPHRTGLDAHRYLRERRIRVPTVILAATLSDETLLECLRTSVEGILLKESAASVLVDAIRAVARGEGWVPPELAARILKLAARRDGREADGLTPREKDVVLLVAAGKSNKRIANDLGIAESTVKLHLHSAFTKLEVANRVELSLAARERGWI